jgi:hypothetical protein
LKKRFTAISAELKPDGQIVSSGRVRHFPEKQPFEITAQDCHTRAQAIASGAIPAGEATLLDDPCLKRRSGNGTDAGFTMTLM